MGVIVALGTVPLPERIPPAAASPVAVTTSLALALIVKLLASCT